MPGNAITDHQLTVAALIHEVAVLSRDPVQLVDHPRAVILVKVDKPEDTRGQEVAAPVFRKVAEAVIAAMDLPDDQPVIATETPQP